MWQPIETAPKGENYIGGSVMVDLWSGSNRYPNCFYDHESGLWTMIIRYLTKAGHRKTSFAPIKDPTHWQPLPPPPDVVV